MCPKGCLLKYEGLKKIYHARKAVSVITGKPLLACNVRGYDFNAEIFELDFL